MIIYYLKRLKFIEQKPYLKGDNFQSKKNLAIHDSENYKELDE